jgi:hypothetical protein
MPAFAGMTWEGCRRHDGGAQDLWAVGVRVAAAKVLPAARDLLHHHDVTLGGPAYHRKQLPVP